MSGNNPSYVAGADLATSIFVKFAATGVSNTVHPAADGDAPMMGVTNEGSREAPIPSITPLAAKSGETCAVYGLGETCEIKVGASAIDAGDFLMADSDGKATPATTGKYYGAVALADAAASSRVKAQIVFGQLN